jgi:hypothetical protein
LTGFRFRIGYVVLLIQEQAARLSAVSRRIGECSAGTVEINGQVSEAVRRVAVGAGNQVAQTEGSIAGCIRLNISMREEGG